MGAGLIGLVVSTIIYGITCLQTYLYYTKYSGNDRWPMKLIVALIWVLESFQLVLATLLTYHYTVTKWGDTMALLRSNWSAAISVECGAVVILIVQCVFARRIWLFSGKNWALTGAIVVLSLFQLAFGTAFTVHDLQTRFVVEMGSKTFKLLASATLSGSIACDIIITMSMCYYLQKSRTGFRSTDTTINLLITYAIRTCLLTTICAISSLAAFLIAQVSIANALYLIGCRLYANSLLSALNVRESIIDRGRLQGNDMKLFPRDDSTVGHSTDDGSRTIIIGSPDGWLRMEALSQPPGSSGVNDDTTPPV